MRDGGGHAGIKYMGLRYDAGAGGGDHGESGDNGAWQGYEGWRRACRNKIPGLKVQWPGGGRGESGDSGLL